MHASLAYVNGAGEIRRHRAGRKFIDSLALLNALLASPDVDQSRSNSERVAEEEAKAAPISKPGGFQNDPPDPTNPNEVRERHQRKVRP